MRIIIAPDSYKGSQSAIDVANAMEKGVKQVFPEAQVHKVPIADGGEGTVEALVMATNGTMLYETVTGPLGHPIKAYWGILGDGETAVIEMAAASGLPLVPPSARDPRVTTTYGTGELIKAALDRGMRKIIIGIGGSATNDGGVGVAQALGIKFLDKSSAELPFGGGALANLARIDLSALDPRLKETCLMVACDVDNPLCGEKGATAVYGPQKGAAPELIAELDANLRHFAQIAKEATGKDVANCPGAGAAGGLGAGLLFFTNAQLRPGVEIILETTGFDKLVQNADLVLTGEGRTDFQTAFGKAPVGVAKVAQKYDVPTVCVSGGLGQGYEDVLQQGIAAVTSVAPGPISLNDCMNNAAELIEAGAKRMCQLIKVGMQMASKG